MIPIGRLADYGIVVMCEIASHAGETLNVRALSRRTKIVQTTLTKVLKLLLRAGLVESMRGPKGGYLTHRTPEEINILEVITAINGPRSLTLCCRDETRQACVYEKHCRASAGSKRVNRSVHRVLARFTVAHFLKENCEQTRSSFSEEGKGIQIQRGEA